MKTNLPTPENFSPPWFLRSGHVQTLLTGFYKPKATLPAPVVHKIPIGSQGDPGTHGHLLVYENLPSDAAQASRPQGAEEAVFLLHGLGSSHRGTYMTNLALYLLEAGVRVFRFDLPGAGDSFEYTPLPPHGACSELLWEALIHLSQNCSIRLWRGVGVSLGGNLLLKLLANHASEIDTGDGARDVSIARAIAVAPPIDLSKCCENMEIGAHRIYAKYFLRSLRSQARLRADRWPEWKRLLANASFETIRRFDETVTAPLAGFMSAQHYYESGSSIGQLERIETPTTVLIDKNDPIVPYSLFEGARWSPSTEVRISQRGGHVGYLHRSMTKTGRGLERWADRWIATELMK